MKNIQIKNFLEENNINYNFFTHPPLLTMDDSYLYTNDIKGEHCKNLFLCDKKRINYYHILTFGQKDIDLKSLQEKIGSTRLSFVTPERLNEILNLTPGCVNPLTMIFTKENVHYYFDEELFNCDLLIFCPSVNDESISMTPNEFKKFIKATKKEVNLINI